METIYDCITKGYHAGCGSVGCGFIIHNYCGSGLVRSSNYCGMRVGPSCG
jgi:hypothetical protein